MGDARVLRSRAMTRTTGRLVTLLALGWMMSLAPSSAAQITIEQIGWLQGCWEMVDGKRSWEEHWMTPRAKTMIGAGRFVREDGEVAFAVVALRAEGERLAYELHVPPSAPVTLRSNAVSESAITFENTEPGNPRRIGYRRTTSETLEAWNEGVADGKTYRNDFVYRRVACHAN